MIVDFQQDPDAPFGTGNFRGDDGKITYLYDPETASQFVPTMPGAKMPSSGAGAAPDAAPAPSIGQQIGQQSTDIAKSVMGAAAPPTTPFGKVQAYLSLDRRTAQNTPEDFSKELPGANGSATPSSPEQVSDFLNKTGGNQTEANASTEQAAGQSLAAPPPPPAPMVTPPGAPEPNSSTPPPPLPPPPPPAPMAATTVSAPAVPALPSLETVGTKTTTGGTVMYGRPEAGVNAQLATEAAPQAASDQAQRTLAQGNDDRAMASVKAEEAGIINHQVQTVATGFEKKAQLQQTQAQIAALNAELEKNDKSLDPDRVVNNMSTGKKVGMAILAALNGAFGALIGQKSNGVIDVIDEQIRQDIEKQKGEIAAGRVRIGNQIAEYQRRGWTLQESVDLTRDKLEAGSDQLTLLKAKELGIQGAQMDQVTAMLAQREEQRAQRRGELVSQIENRVQTTGQTEDTTQVKNGLQTQLQQLQVDKAKAELDKTRLEVDKAKDDARTSQVLQGNADQASQIIGHPVAPEEWKQIQDRIKEVGPGVAETSGAMRMTANFVTALGGKLDETTGKIVWPDDLTGAGPIDSRGGIKSFLPGYNEAESLGLVRPDVANVRDQQNALKEYVAKYLTGASFTEEQKRDFMAMLGGDLSNEDSVKNNVQNWANTLFQNRTDQLARLGPDGQAILAHNQQQAKLGANAPPLVPRGQPQPPGSATAPAAAPPAPAPGAPPAAAPAAPAVPQPAQPPGLTPELKNTILSSAAAAGLDGGNILRVIGTETAGSFAPSTVAKNSPGHAGLLQFGRPEWAEAARLGGRPDISWEQMQTMTTAQQLPFVYAYLKGKGIDQNSSPGDIYLAVAAPGLMKANDSTVAYGKGTSDVAANQGWDLDGDGQVTVGELRRFGAGQRRPAGGTRG